MKLTILLAFMATTAWGQMPKSIDIQFDHLRRAPSLQMTNKYKEIPMPEHWTQNQIRAYARAIKLAARQRARAEAKRKRKLINYLNNFTERRNERNQDD